MALTPKDNKRLVMELLSDGVIRQRLASLSGWALDNKALKKEFKFKDFRAAFGFMAKVAEEAERLNHHPDWSNSYNKVSVSLSTHSAGGLTGKDFDLAQDMERIAADYL